ncbi:WD repeat-containing protein 75-like [Agrilus planipennis]|uniref:WD repeat-containing protein 75-like n=1 Tax=Agrilus planipennis TaxID=224129 RepID=A0A7F5RNU5_AGRPL|nr:WD repeat-containing protein 75-like [Agrilus planipennis]XP_025837699.1 WD repeat-containing protein 75-like [Agrilus planipennis]
MDVRIKFRGGGSVTACAPVFSEGEEFVYIPWKNIVLCYYTKTGKRARELRGLKDNVVGFNIVNYKDKECLFACSITGEMISWSIDDSCATIKSKIPSQNILIRKFLTTSWSKNDEEQRQVHLLSWTKNITQDKSLSLGLFDMSVGKLREVKMTLEDTDHDIATGGSDNPFFAIVQGQTLYFARLKDGKHIYKRRIHGRKFTCVACHPHDESVLTGDNTGRILLWHNLSSTSPTQAVYHWHTLPVKTVTFSRTGSYFFSGADECVLVKWAVENPEQRQYLPRMSFTIERVTVSKDNVLVAVTTRDNVVHILDFRLERVSTIQHLVLGRNFPAGIHYDPRTGALAMNGIVGHLQFFSPNDMSLLYNLDITGQNKLTKERNVEIENTDVVKLAIDRNGKWLATVEKRDSATLKYELRLKFWQFNLKDQQYTLNTCIEYPHENSVEDVCFQPSLDANELRCVTVGGDSKFRVWEIVNADTVYQKGVRWSCFVAGFYKNLPCKCLDFSSDGSVFAVSFDFAVTLWETRTCDFKYSLSCPQLRGERITQVKFGSANRCQLLVSATEDHAVLWNLLTLNAVWIVKVHVSFLLSSCFSSYMAIFTEDSKVIIFDPNDPSPVYVSEELRMCNTKVLTAVFAPKPTIVDLVKKGSWCSNVRLYFIDSYQELYCFDSATEDIYGENTDIIESESKSLFSATIPKLKSGCVGVQEKKEHTIKRFTDLKKMREFLDAPANTMAPIRLSCETILKLLVESRTNKRKDGCQKTL